MESEMIETGVEESEVEEDLSETEPDLPPEYCHYRDEGCELFGSCLNCPLAQCIYDIPRGRQHRLKDLRNREMTRLFIDEGKRVKELALIFGISPRTVQRALKSTLAASPTKEGEKHQKEDTE